MKLSDIFFTILYGCAFILVIYFIFGLIYKPVPSTVVVYDEVPVYKEPVWPWAYGPYNWWPYWSGWWSGGGNGGYGYYGRRWGPHRGGVRHFGGGGRPYGGAGRGANVGIGGGPRGGGGGGRR
jgi:hypothetical protein